MFLGPRLVSAESALQPIQNSQDDEWDGRKAPDEVSGDVDALIDRYDKEKNTLRKIAKKFKSTRIKDTGVRRLAEWGISLARVYDLPGLKKNAKNRIYQRTGVLADHLLDSFVTIDSYIEGTTMRGWPMYVDTNDEELSFEGFNYGWFGTSICNAARIAADNGDDEKAGQMVTRVLEAMYDGFLTRDKEKTKLDEQGWVVYVPNFASEGRKERHKEAASQKYCLDTPQAYNHGIMVARAAMACDKAIDAISWKQAKWDMKEWTRPQAQRQLSRYIIKSAKLLLGEFEELRSRKNGKYDQYPGSRSRYFQWKYRNLSTCPEERDTFKNRFEDIAHGPYETQFVQEYSDWGGSLDNDELHKLIVTFLNHLVHDYIEGPEGRFACDVAGTHDNSKEGAPRYPEKQCKNARDVDKRAQSAPLWLTLAYGVRDDVQADKTLRCDALLMVKTVLPLLLPGEQFDKEHFEEIDSKWGSHAIQAKYYYYNFEAAFEKDCKDLDI